MDARQVADGEVCGGDRYRAARLAALVRDHRRAAACYRRAVHLYTELGYRSTRAETLGDAGDAHHAAGDLAAARDAWQEALAIVDELHYPEADQLRAKLRALATGAPLEPASSPVLRAASRR